MAKALAVREDLRQIRRTVRALKNVYDDIRADVSDMRVNISAIRSDVVEINSTLAGHSAKFDNVIERLDRCHREVSEALDAAEARGLLDRASALNKGREIAVQHDW